MPKHSLFLFILVGALVLALVACGSQATEEPAQQSFQPTKAPAATEAPATAEAPAESEAEPEEAAEDAEPEEVAPETEEAAAETEVEEVELFGDPIRGGVLYDKWWPPLGLDAPEEDQPLWATQDSNTRSGADTWRCKECHGWDYKGADGAYGSGSHFTGFVGVLDAAGKGGGYVLGALQGETNPAHDFSAVMDEQALTDIALFIVEETMDYDQFIGKDKMAVGGDLVLGEELFQDCVDCHGIQGTAINFGNVADPEYVGGLASGNPWEFTHKLRFGQPGEPDMPAAIDSGWTEEEQLAALAYAQSLPASSPVSEGGLLYDKWWAALGADEPEGDQPLWATQDTNVREGADTWRCKECHGWDYKGADGAYGSGSHFTGFTGILEASSIMSVDELVAWLNGTTNPNHDFSKYLGEDQIDQMVAFMQEGLVDMSEFINDDKTVNGDPDNGQALYNAVCKRCHGENGVSEDFVMSILSNDNPWEVYHKITVGQPGEKMPSGINFGWTAQDVADILSYAQTLPKE